MYEDAKARANEFAIWVGIDVKIAEIFVKRIPLKINKVSTSGKIHVIDGDTIIYSVLCNIAEKKNSVSSEDRQVIQEKYTSFHTHGIQNTHHKLPTIKQLTVEKKLKRYMPKGYVSIADLTEDEINVLYDWIKN